MKERRHLLMPDESRNGHPFANVERLRDPLHAVSIRPVSNDDQMSVAFEQCNRPNKRLHVLLLRDPSHVNDTGPAHTRKWIHEWPLEQLRDDARRNHVNALLSDAPLHHRFLCSFAQHYYCLCAPSSYSLEPRSERSQNRRAESSPIEGVPQVTMNREDGWRAALGGQCAERDYCEIFAEVHMHDIVVIQTRDPRRGRDAVELAKGGYRQSHAAHGKASGSRNGRIAGRAARHNRLPEAKSIQRSRQFGGVVLHPADRIESGYGGRINVLGRLEYRTQTQHAKGLIGSGAGIIDGINGSLHRLFERTPFGRPAHRGSSSIPRGIYLSGESSKIAIMQLKTDDARTPARDDVRPFAPRWVFGACLLIYVVALAWVTLRPRPSSFQPSAEWIPLNNIIGVLREGRSVSYQDAGQLLGNIALFVPFGWLVPMLWPRLRSFWTIVLLAAVTSLAIEVAQWLFIDGRQSSVDDVILNTVGALVGAVMFFAPRNES